jgi:class 3 adenylate cyclase
MTQGSRRARLRLDEVAERAGVAVTFVERLVGLAIVVPDEDGAFSQGDVFRARLMRSTDRAGVPLEAVAKAIEAGAFTLAFLDMPHYRWSVLSDVTFEELAASTGIPTDFLLLAEEAQGSERRAPGDRVRQDIVEMAPVLKMSLDAGIDPAVFPRVIRAYTTSIRRIAEAEADVYHNYVETPLLRSGLGHKEMAKLANEFGAEITQAQERMLLGMYRRQQELVWTADTIEHMEEALEEIGLYERPERAPAIAFLDLVGYTRLTEERGDRAAAELAGRLGDLVEVRSRVHGGRPVKWLGDGMMLLFSDPAEAVRAALAMVDEIPVTGLPPAHVGVATGPVIMQEGDYYGRTVNLAARLAGRAEANQTLVEAGVVRVVDASDLRFEERGRAELKGIQAPVDLFEAVRVSDG